MKKILHLNNGLVGGPGRFMFNVCNALEKEYENIIIVPRIIAENIFKNKNYRIVEIYKKNFYFSRILSKFFQYTSKIKIQKDSMWPEVYCKDKSKKILEICNNEIDIIILYWYKNFIDTDTVLKLYKKTKAKIYIYLMDNFPMTGGCHYPVKCKRYEIGCGNCPSILYGKIKKDITHRNSIKNKKNLEEAKVTIICPTSFSLEEADKSYILKNLKKELVLGGLPDKYFLNTLESGNKKNNNINLFFGAQSLKNERKGMLYLINALKKVYQNLNETQRNNINLYIAGNEVSEDIKKIGLKIEYLGYLDNEELIKVYQKVDVFISPSIVDMGPMMVNESIASGTPVICFPIGVAKDLVINKKTGFIAKDISSDSLAEEILKFCNLEEEIIIEMKKNCKTLSNKKLRTIIFNENLKKIFSKV